MRLSPAIACAAALLPLAARGQVPLDSLDPPRVEARALERAGKTAAALRVLRAASAVAPDRAELYPEIARLSDRLGRRGDALDAYRRYEALEPDEPRSHELLGWFYLESSEHERALQELRVAVRLAPNRSSAVRGVGMILVTLGRNEEALRAFAEAARLDPTDATVWGQMALAAEAVARPSEAISYWERAIRVTPGYFDQRPAERQRWEQVIAQQGPQPPAPLDAEAAASAAAAEATNVSSSEGPAASYTSSGSGFVVAAHGFVLTNKHVVRGCDALRVRGDSGVAVRARVVALDTVNDLALLHADDAPWPNAIFRAGAAPRAGDDVIAAGFPLNGLLADQVNVSTGSISALAGMYNDQRALQMSAPVQPGSSGGPLFDASGNIVGVVVTKLNAKVVAEAMGDIPQNVNFAIKGSVARAFLDAQHVAYDEAPSTTARSHADVGDIGRRVTVLVECWK